MVHWRPNLFKIPSLGMLGRCLFQRLLNYIWLLLLAQALSLSKVACVMPRLLLQKVSSESKDKDNCQILENRFKKWNKGKFDDLLKEVRAIQARLNKGQRYKSNQSVSLSRSFAGLMFQGKAESAIQLLG